MLNDKSAIFTEKERRQTLADKAFLESLYYQIAGMLKQIDDADWPNQTVLSGAVVELEGSLQESMAEILGGILSCRHDLLAYEGKAAFIDPAEFQEKAMLAEIVKARTKGRESYKDACASVLKIFKSGEASKKNRRVAHLRKVPVEV